MYESGVRYIAPSIISVLRLESLAKIYSLEVKRGSKLYLLSSKIKSKPALALLLSAIRMAGLKMIPDLKVVEAKGCW